MKSSVGVRELRQMASDVLRRVENGTTVEVTSRGRIVARLVPVRHTRTRERLIAQGRLVPAAGDALDLGAPVRSARRVPLPGAALKQARANER